MSVKDWVAGAGPGNRGATAPDTASTGHERRRRQGCLEHETPHSSRSRRAEFPAGWADDCRHFPSPWRGTGPSCGTQAARRVDRHAQVCSCLRHCVRIARGIRVSRHWQCLAVTVPGAAARRDDALLHSHGMPDPAREVASAGQVGSWNTRPDIPYSCHA